MTRAVTTAIIAHFGVHDAPRAWAAAPIDAKFVAWLREVFVECVDHRLERFELTAHNVTFHVGGAVQTDNITLVISDQGFFWWTAEPIQYHDTLATERQAIEVFASNLMAGTIYFAEDPEALRRMTTDSRTPEGCR